MKCARNLPPRNGVTQKFTKKLKQMILSQIGIRKLLSTLNKNLGAESTFITAYVVVNNRKHKTLSPPPPPLSFPYFVRRDNFSFTVKCEWKILELRYWLSMWTLIRLQDGFSENRKDHNSRHLWKNKPKTVLSFKIKLKKMRKKILKCKANIICNASKDTLNK